MYMVHILFSESTTLS